MASISSLVSQTSSYETFVQQLVQIESQKKLNLEIKQEEGNERKSALGQVSSAISKFENKIKELENPANKSFEPFSTSTSDESVVKINSASGIDRPSNYDITIHRLATRDNALSEVMNGEGIDLSADGDGSVTLTIGDKTETITVETNKEDENGDIVERTNQEILESFAEEITNVFGEEARASVFQVDSDNVQFSVQSLQTGFDQRIQFNDASGVLDTIISSVSHQAPQEELNASFTIDGITFERGQNEISDAIEGLSFTLLKDTGQKEQMNVERDINKAKSNINGFIAAFNDLNTTIRNKTFVDGDTGDKGSLQGMRTIRNLTMSLRQTALIGLDGVGAGEISRLSDLGISFESNGNMTLEDSDKLDQALTEDPEQVNRLFTDEQSSIAQMKALVNGFTKTGGVLSSLENGVDYNLDTIKKRIAKEEKYLIDYEEKQREIFNQLDLILEQGQAQFEQVMNFRTSMGI